MIQLTRFLAVRGAPAERGGPLCPATRNGADGVRQVEGDAEPVEHQDLDRDDQGDADDGHVGVDADSRLLRVAEFLVGGTRKSSIRSQEDLRLDQSVRRLQPNRRRFEIRPRLPNCCDRC